MINHPLTLETLQQPIVKSWRRSQAPGAERFEKHENIAKITTQ